MGIGVVALFVSLLVLLDPETVAFILLLGPGYVLALSHIGLIIYLFTLLRRPDPWLSSFLVVSAVFAGLLVWFLALGVREGLRDLRIFAFGGIVYAVISIAVAIAISSRSLGNGHFKG